MVIPLKLFLTQRERVCVWEKKRNKETLRYITRTGGPQLITGRLPVTVPGSEPTLYSWYDVELLNTIKDHLHRPSFSPLCMSQHVCFLLGPLPYVVQWDCNARIGNDLPFLTRMWFLIYPPLSLSYFLSLPRQYFYFFFTFLIIKQTHISEDITTWRDRGTRYSGLASTSPRPSLRVHNTRCLIYAHGPI